MCVRETHVGYKSDNTLTLLWLEESQFLFKCWVALGDVLSDCVCVCKCFFCVGILKDLCETRAQFVSVRCACVQSLCNMEKIVLKVFFFPSHI